MKDHELQFVAQAVEHYETQKFMKKLSELLGKPMERGLNALPTQVTHMITESTKTALQKALNAALFTLEPQFLNSRFQTTLTHAPWNRLIHTGMAACTGAASGAFGIAALPLELPLTTLLMLRSIAQTASSYGENLKDPEVQLECLSVLSLGAPTQGTPPSDLSYFSTRLTLARMITQASLFVTRKTAVELSEAIARGAAPALLQFISRIAARFEIVVTEKLLAHAVPIVGAATGAGINILFTHHFNENAKYHFGLKSLERKYGSDHVRSIYEDKMEFVKKHK
jgi:hypothetical protein